MSSETSTQRIDRHFRALFATGLLATPIGGLALIPALGLEIVGYEQLGSKVLLSIMVGLLALTYVQAYRGVLE